MTDTSNVGSRLRNAATELERADEMLGADLGDTAVEKRRFTAQALSLTRRAMGTKTCPECALEFMACERRSDAKFCSMRCAQRAATKASADRAKR